MRKSMFVAVSLLFVVASAFAQETARSNTVSVFVSDLSVVESSSSGTNVDAAYGVAFDHMFNKRVSAELSVMSRRIHESSGVINAAGVPVFTYFTDTVYPFDATVSYHFFTNSRWKPYLGGGVRYVSGFAGTTDPFSRHRSSNTINPEITGGVTFQFRPALGLRFDVKQTVTGSNSVPGNSSLNASVGLAFRF